MSNVFPLFNLFNRQSYKFVITDVLNKIAKIIIVIITVTILMILWIFGFYLYVTYQNIEINYSNYEATKTQSTLEEQTVEKVEEDSKKVVDVIEETTRKVVGISKLKNTGNSILSKSTENELGLGTGTIHLTPNYKDREIAYKLWIELSTRKLGLKLNWDEDVIVEVYNSWYAFFGVSRELLKEFPITKLNNDEDYKLIIIITKLLNDVLRKHLTTWQAKFRKWYAEELDKEENIGLTPQEIQEKYVYFNAIKDDMDKINGNLIYFMEELYLIATNGGGDD